MVQLGQRTAAVAGGRAGRPGRGRPAADVVGGAGFGDAQGLVAVGEAALLAVGAGRFHPQGGAALGDRDVAAHEWAGRVAGEACVAEGHQEDQLVGSTLAG